MPSKRQSHGGLGGASYRLGALERLREAYILLQTGRFGGSIYLAGRGVEGMLRAVIWTRDPDIRTGRKSLETGHDLGELLVIVRDLGILRSDEPDARLAANIQRVARLWHNNMRFALADAIHARWRSLGEVTKRRSFKLAAAAFCDACSAVIKRCEVLCEA